MQLLRLAGHFHPASPPMIQGCGRDTVDFSICGILLMKEQNPSTSIKAISLLQGWEGVLQVRVLWGRTGKQSPNAFGLNMVPRDLTAEKVSSRPMFQFKFSANSASA